MDGLLDDEALDGAHGARIGYRPQRIAVPLADRREDTLIEAVRHECQIWGGAVSPLIPIDGKGIIQQDYLRILAGSAVDGVRGLHPFDLFHLEDAKVTLPESGRAVHGSQLAVALLEHENRDNYRTLEIVDLPPNDPWRCVYAACLGLLPEDPSPELLKEGHLLPDLRFDDFLNIDRVSVQGSFEDLLERLNAEDRLTPRRLSMVHLAYGNSGSTSIRWGPKVLPSEKFDQFDAGPNVVVVCSPNSTEDAALLWNLRGAHGDFWTLPIGIPVTETSTETIRKLLFQPRISRNGMAAKNIYITSASLSVEMLHDLLGESDDDEFGVVPHERMLTFGYPGGWTRDEVLNWHQGKARFVPLPPDSHRKVLSERGLGDLADMQLDVQVLDSPFPTGDDVRIDAPNYTFYAGAQSRREVPRNRAEVREVMWPSRLLMAKSIAASRGLHIRESEPGRAGRIALAGMGDVDWLTNLLHAPLLSLLENMAARQGFPWYKNRLRNSGIEVSPVEAVGAATDELPEKSYSDFKRALGNSEKATKYWLIWAEKSRLIVKGFQLKCPTCGAKQWIPVAGFVPPITCRGCAEEMTTPFGDRPNIDFKYRLSEPLRRVYEQDAMGHLLAMYFFHSLFHVVKGSKLIGLHPGMEICNGANEELEGEADVLLVTREAEFIPVEIKRTSTGFVKDEIEKLDHLGSILDAPWSALATCQYAKDVSDDFPNLGKRRSDSSYSRIVLSYDLLLERVPIWSLGHDPFEWKPLTDESIAKREAEFVKWLAAQAETGTFDWMGEYMLRKPPKSNT